MGLGISLGITIKGQLPDSGGGGIPPNALLDEDGNPILDEDGNFIIDEE